MGHRAQINSNSFVAAGSCLTAMRRVGTKECSLSGNDHDLQLMKVDEKEDWYYVLYESSLV
jgi:hypothetical protein